MYVYSLNHSLLEFTLNQCASRCEAPPCSTKPAQILDFLHRKGLAFANVYSGRLARSYIHVNLLV